MSDETDAPGGAYREIIREQRQLINELADALERKHREDSEEGCPHCQALSALIGRAREATR